MADQTARKSIFERHPVLTLLGLAIIAFGTIDVALAYALTIVLGHPLHQPPEPSVKVPEVNRRFRSRSPIYHHDLKPNMSEDAAIWGNRTFRVRTDSLGFRSASVKSTKPSATRYRILFIGDSFTEGIGVDYDDTFVGVIAGALRARGVEVLNAGVTSYSPLIYWRKVKYLIEDVGLEFDELVVFIDLSDIEDEANHYRLTGNGNVTRIRLEQPAGAQDDSRSEGSSLTQMLQTHTVFTYYIAKSAENALFARKKLRTQATGRTRARWSIDPALFESYGKEGLERASRAMDRLADLLAHNRIPLTVAVYPWPDQIVSSDLDSVQVSFWRAWANDRGARFLNYFPCFINTTKPEEILDTYFIPGDVHWNERGHELIARMFLETYRQPRNDCCCE